MSKCPGKLAVPFCGFIMVNSSCHLHIGKSQSEMLELSKWKQPGMQPASLMRQVQVLLADCCKNKCFQVESHNWFLVVGH